MTLKAHDLETTPVPQGLVIWWPGSAATIPSGFEVANGAQSVNDPTYTRPDRCSIFPKGDSDGALGTGGALTHTHTVPSHTHGGNTTVPTSAYTHAHSEGDQSRVGYTDVHTHPINGTTDTLDSQSNTPPWVEHIPIVYTMKAGGAGKVRIHDLAASALPPYGMIGEWPTTSSFPTGWSECDGATTNGVAKPNLRGKFLKGIPTTGTAPADQGGSATHQHAATHSHNFSTHTTANSKSGDFAEWTGVGNHAHDANSEAVSADSQTLEPPFKETKFACFHGHGSSQAAHALGKLTVTDMDPTLIIQRGTMVAFPSTSMPSGWAHADGGAWSNGTPSGHAATKPDMRSKFLKHAANGAGGGGTGGAASHTHAAAGHTHTTQTSSGTHVQENAAGYPLDNDTTHTHSTTATSWTGANFAADNTPPSYTVAFAVRD